MTNPSFESSSSIFPQPRFTAIQKFLKLKQPDNIQGLIISLEPCKEIYLKSGKVSLMQRIKIQDATTSVSVILWGDHCRSDLELNDKVQLIGAYWKLNSFSKRPEVQLVTHGKLIRTAWPASLSSLTKGEQRFLIDLKRMIKQNLPLLSKLSRKSFGLSIEDGHISALSIYMLGLSDIPQSIGRLGYLERLYLNNNHLEKIPDEFGSLTSLISLDLRWNKLFTLPSSMNQCEKLRYLNLNYNKFTTVPVVLAELPDLEVLKLENNDIKEIKPPLPRALYHKYQVKYPEVEDNSELTVLITLEILLGEPLPKVDYLGRTTFGYTLRNGVITGIGLYFRNLKEFPCCLQFLRQLEILNLSYNSFKTLPDLPQLFPFLTTVYALGNRWTSYPPSLITVQSYKYQHDSIPEKEKRALSILDLHLNESLIHQKVWSDEKTGYYIQKGHISGLSIVNHNLSSNISEFEHFSHLTSLNLKFCHLSHFPEFLKLFGQLTHLDLSHNEISTIPNWFHKDCFPHLQVLNIDANSIVTIPAQLGHFPELHTLSCNMNQILSCELSFSPINDIRILNFSNNRISILQLNFAAIPSLEELDVSFNNLLTISGDVFTIPRISSVNLAYNRLSDLPTTLFQNQTLRELNVSYNQLTLTQSQVNFLESLSPVSLVLDSTQLLGNHTEYSSLLEEEQRIMETLELILNERIPELHRVSKNTFGFKKDLGHVVKLCLPERDLSFFPEVITHLTRLQWLSITKNKIKNLPASLQTLKLLKYLDLSENMLETLPTEIGALESLQILKLEMNLLDSLPSSFENLRAVKELRLHHNRFISIPGELWSLKDLRKIPFHFSELSSFSQTVLRKGVSAMLDYAQQRRFFYDEILKCLETNLEMPVYLAEIPDLCYIASILYDKCQIYQNDAAIQLQTIIENQCSFQLNEFKILL